MKIYKGGKGMVDKEFDFLSSDVLEVLIGSVMLKAGYIYIVGIILVWGSKLSDSESKLLNVLGYSFYLGACVLIYLLFVSLFS